MLIIKCHVSSLNGDILGIGVGVDAFVMDGVAVGREELRRWVCPDQWRMGLGIQWANDKKGDRWTSEVPIDPIELLPS